MDHFLSRQVIAAGVAWIVASALGALLALIVGLILLAGSISQTPSATTAWLHLACAAAWLFAIVELFAGVFLLRLRSWALKLVTFGALVLIVFALWCAYFAVFLRFSGASIPGDDYFLLNILPLAGSLSFALGVWCLTLFTRPSVLAKFTRQTAVLSARCPLPITVLCAFMLSSLVVSAIQLAQPQRVPGMAFGYALFGAPWKIYRIAYLVALALGAALVLRLKPWALKLLIGVCAYGGASSLVSRFSANSVPHLREAVAAMVRQGYPPVRFDTVRYEQLNQNIASIVAFLTVAILLIWRSGFNDSAKRQVQPE